MYGLGNTVAVSAELEQARDELQLLTRRVAEAAHSAPRRDASGWSGIAAWAYQHSLDQLSRELAVAHDLLRSATDLTAAALIERGGHA